MIPQESVGGLRIPLGRRFGIFPRYHKAALFLNFDEQPSPDDSGGEYIGDITVHGHTMYLGTCCDGVIKVDWQTNEIRFESDSARFDGHFDPRTTRIEGTISLHAVENLDCERLPICFKPIE